MAAVIRRRVLLAGALLAAGAVGGCGSAASEPAPGTPRLTADPLPRAQGRPSAAVGLPSDPGYRQSPRAVVVLIRGGGWTGPSPSTMRAQHGAAVALQDQGFATVEPDYRSGIRGYRDLLARYDQTRKRFPSQRICLFGQSAGGHLALLIAEERRDVACVVSQAGPTDLTTLAEQTSEPTGRWAAEAFGSGRLARFSPVRRAARIDAAVLQIAAENDRYVPVAQVRELQPRLRRGRLIVLPPGGTTFVHSKVDADALGRAGEAQTAFLMDAGRDGGSASADR